MFNFNHLYYFYVVASSESLTAAAQRLKVSQPALSTQIKTLEASLERSLFVKVGRRLELTPDGKMTLGHCRRIFEAASELADALKLEPIARTERLGFGVADEIERPFAADIASQMLHLRSEAHQPPTSVRMETGDHYVMLEQVQSRSIDCLLTNYPSPREDMHTYVTAQMPVRAYVSSRFRKELRLPTKAASGANTTLKPREFTQIMETLGEDVGLALCTPGQKLRAEAEVFLEKCGYRGRLAFEANALAPLVRSVVDGVGVGFFPAPYVAPEVRLGRLVEISEAALWSHPLYLIGPADSEHRIAEFKAALINVCKNLDCQLRVD